MVIDLVPITDAATQAALVGGAIVLVILGVLAFKLVRRAMS